MHGAGSALPRRTQLLTVPSGLATLRRDGFRAIVRGVREHHATTLLRRSVRRGSVCSAETRQVRFQRLECQLRGGSSSSAAVRRPAARSSVATQDVDRVVARDRDQPRSCATAVAVRTGCAVPDAHEAFLQRLVGQSPAAGSQAGRPAGVADHAVQVFERRAVTQCATSQQAFEGTLSTSPGRYGSAARVVMGWVSYGGADWTLRAGRAVGCTPGTKISSRCRLHLHVHWLV